MAKATAVKARSHRTMTAANVAAQYGSTQHATDDAAPRYAVMWRRELKGVVVWQQMTPRLRNGAVELLSRTGIVARLAPTDRITVSDEVRDGDAAVSWHLLKAVHVHGTQYGATQCTEPHLRGYGADGTSYCYARKAKTGSSTRKASLTAEAAALAADEAAKAKRADAARKAAATRKAAKAAKAAATADAPTVAADAADAALATAVAS